MRIVHISMHISMHIGTLTLKAHRSSLKAHSYYSLVARRPTIMGFQVEKSPAMMCLRASPTSQR